MNRRMICVFVLLMVVSGVAEAGAQMVSSHAETWEFSIQTRYSWAKDYTSENGSAVNLNDDLGWGFGFGYNISEKFNLGFAFNWRSVYYNATIVNSEDPTDTRTYGNNLDTSAFTVNGHYYFGKGRFKPYLTGNFGWVGFDTNIVADVDSGCWWYPYYGYVCGSYTQTYGTDAFTYGLGLGLRFDLSRAAFLRAGWDHQWDDIDAMDSTDMLRIELGFEM